jgi:hypothetical protein
MDKSGSEGAKESGKGRGTERAMPIGHEASAGKRLKREEEKRAEWDKGGGRGVGTSKCQRLEPAALVPVRKGTWDEGESKKEQVVLVNRACP